MWELDKALQLFMNLYNKNYVASNMAIVFAGDFNPDEVIVKIDKAFAYMPSADPGDYIGPKEEPLKEPVMKEVYGPDAEYVQMGFRLPGADNYNDVVRLSVVDNLFERKSRPDGYQSEQTAETAYFRNGCAILERLLGACAFG